MIVKKVSILIPCYNEEQVLPLLFARLEQLFASLPQYSWELLFVNDGSADQTLAVIKEYRQHHNFVRYIDLSRNFGKELAMMAGLDFVDADCTIIMDADLQHPPEVIPELLQYWELGFDDVAAQRRSLAQASLFKNISSKLFHKIFSKVVKTPIQEHVGDFRLLDRMCVDAMKQIRDAHRYTKGLYSWIGFRKKIVMYDEPLRTVGKGKFSLFQLINLGVEGFTSFTIFPLRIAFFMGLFFVFLSLILLLFFGLISSEFEFNNETIIIFSIFFLGGIQLLSIGILGEYIGRMFMEVKPRPAYLVREKE